MRDDIRFALRGLRRNRTFAAAAILALGLGAGAATAVFSLLEGVVLKPLPYAEPQQLVMLWETNTKKDLQHEQLSPVNLVDYRSLSNVFTDVAAWWRPEVNLVDNTGDPVRASTVETSENLFRVLGVNAAIGRTFDIHPELYAKDAPEAVISDRLWRTRFSADLGIVGKVVSLDGFPYTIIGVMPRGFHFPGNTDVWQRLGWSMAQHSRDAHFMEAIGRLRPGVPIDQADRELRALTIRLGQEHPHTNEGWSARAVALGSELAGAFRPGLFALFGAAGLLLVIACINIANLLLARTNARKTEIAVRAALGASRWRLVRQLLSESLVLAIVGTAVGFAVAQLAVRSLLAWSPIEIPRSDEIGLNVAVLGFTAALTVLTALLFGLAPALVSSRMDLHRTLKETMRGAAGRATSTSRAALIIAEIALAVALLSGAGLLIRSVARLAAESTGVNATSSVAIDIQLPFSTYKDTPSVARFYTALLDALRTTPRIASAGASNFLPLDEGWRIPYGTELQPFDHTRAQQTTAQYHTVDEGYFRALGVPLKRGREFDSRDTDTAPGVVIVNDAFARAAYPGVDPVGRHITSLAHNIGPLGRRLVESDDHVIVGVVADIKNSSLKAPAEPAIYSALRQFPFRKMYIVVRGEGTPAELASLVRAEVGRLDPNLPIGEVRTMQRVLSVATDPPRFVMLVMSVFAALALLLAAIGIYGILSYTVSQRAREMGIRMALGARPRDVLSLVVREGMLLGAAGALIGVAIAAAGGRLLSSFLYQVKPADPLTLAAVSALVLAVAVVACLAPARRAAHTDPVHTLRM